MCEKDMEKALNEPFAMEVTLEPPSLDRKPLLTEVFTKVQRVIRQVRKRGHSTGTPMSLETGWNFLLESDRKAAMKQIAEEAPYLLVLSFPCGPWSALMRLSPSKDLEN